MIHRTDDDDDMVTETIMVIGETALPFLKISKEKYAKDLAEKINREIMKYRQLTQPVYFNSSFACPKSSSPCF